MLNYAIIVGGTGQLGRTLSKELLKNKYKIIITTRNLTKGKKIFENNKSIKLEQLNVLKKDRVKNLILKYKPKIIFYFAGQSLPKLSFSKQNLTYQSNFVGCKNFLDALVKTKHICKFVNSASSEIYGNSLKKVGLKTMKKPLNPYGHAKLRSFQFTKKYRDKYKMNNYNAIIFNTESEIREKNFLIPKICIAALNAKKYGYITKFGNLQISREWNWCKDQCFYLLKFVRKKPQDFILSNGKSYSAIQMLKFAFNYLKLDYKSFILQDKKFYRKKDVNSIRSNYKLCLKRNNIKRQDKIYGEILIKKMINHFKKDFN